MMEVNRNKDSSVTLDFIFNHGYIRIKLAARIAFYP